MPANRMVLFIFPGSLSILVIAYRLPEP